MGAFGPGQTPPALQFDPAKLQELQQRYIADASALWNQGLQEGADTLVSSDRRFSSAAWKTNPVSKFSASAYLLNARTLMALAFGLLAGIYILLSAGALSAAFRADRGSEVAPATWVLVAAFAGLAAATFAAALWLGLRQSGRRAWTRLAWLSLFLAVLTLVTGGLGAPIVAGLLVLAGAAFLLRPRDLRVEPPHLFDGS